MNIPETLKTNLPVNEEQILQISNKLSCPLPHDLIEFYKLSNGAEGSLGEHGYIQLWDTDSLIKRNENLKIATVLPDTFIFGSNGGELMYSYNKKDGYLIVDKSDMKNEIFIGGNTLEALFSKISEGLLDK